MTTQDDLWQGLMQDEISTMNTMRWGLRTVCLFILHLSSLVASELWVAPLFSNGTVVQSEKPIAVWKNKTLPLYCMQVANFGKRDSDSKSTGAIVRKARRMMLKLPPVGMDQDIHPKDKKDLCLRLDWHALAHLPHHYSEFP